MRIPWDLIIKQAPSLMTAAGQLALNVVGRRDEVAKATDLKALRDQVGVLAGDQQSMAGLVKELTGQLDAVTKAARLSAERALLGLILGSIGLVLGLTALVLTLRR
jgi:hypothetical protein